LSQRVFLALSRDGFNRLTSSCKPYPSPIWVNFGVLSRAELSDLRNRGLDVTDFVVRIDPLNRQQLAEAIYTVRQHHRGRVIVVGDNSDF
jgi:hypothetical protein